MMLKKPGFWPASDKNLFESASSTKTGFLFKVQSELAGLYPIETDKSKHDGTLRPGDPRAGRLARATNL